MCHWCSLTSSVIYYRTNTRQNGIFSLYMINKQRLLMVMSSLPLSSNRSYVWTNQTCTILLIMHALFSSFYNFQKLKLLICWRQSSQILCTVIFWSNISKRVFRLHSLCHFQQVFLPGCTLVICYLFINLRRSKIIDTATLVTSRVTHQKLTEFDQSFPTLFSICIFTLKF